MLQTDRVVQSIEYVERWLYRLTCLPALLLESRYVISLTPSTSDQIDVLEGVDAMLSKGIVRSDLTLPELEIVLIVQWRALLYLEWATHAV
jgi:hypothetical protein